MNLAGVRCYLALGRLHGAGLTMGCAAAGVLTAAGEPPSAAVYLLALAVGLLTHLGGAAANELAGLDEDRLVPELACKPLVSGALKVRQAALFSAACLGAAGVLSIVAAGRRPTLILAAGVAFALYYNFHGKYQPWTYEFSLGIGVSLGLIYGASLAGGLTPLTGVAAGVVFIAVSFAQWAGGLKDVVSDRLAGVPTCAVRWGYQPGAFLGLADPNFRVALSLKSAALMIYALPALGLLSGPRSPFAVDPIYGWLFLLLVLPSQSWILVRLTRPMERPAWLRLIATDLAVTWIMAPVLVLAPAGLAGAIALGLLPLVWLLAASLALAGKVGLPRL